MSAGAGIPAGMLELNAHKKPVGEALLRPPANGFDPFRITSNDPSR
jgi:hypothetical protein